MCCLFANLSLEGGRKEPLLGAPPSFLNLFAKIEIFVQFFFREGRGGRGKGSSSTPASFRKITGSATGFVVFWIYFCVELLSSTHFIFPNSFSDYCHTDLGVGLPDPPPTATTDENGDEVRTYIPDFPDKISVVFNLYFISFQLPLPFLLPDSAFSASSSFDRVSVGPQRAR